jgi:hypothetical protein
MKLLNCCFRPLLLLPFIFCGSYAFSQAVVSTPTSEVITKTQPFKPPVVKTFIGGQFTGDSTMMPVEQAKIVIGLPLTVRDKNNNIYTITHYEFTYKRVGVTEDEETGTVSPETDIVGNEFTTTPLPEIWIKTINDSLHKNEELHFFDIIVKDNKGHVFYAPDIRFIMQ